MDLLESERASCAVHADAQSTGTCARCGNFVCPLCLDPDSFDERCELCREREGAERIAWERTSEPLGRRFLETMRGVLLYPAATFERAQPGSLGRAVGFHALITLLVVVPFLVVYAVFAFSLSDDLMRLTPGATEGLLAFSVVFYAALWTALLAGVPVARGLLFHLASRLLGGKGSVGASLWAAHYVGACHLFLLLVGATLLVPIVGPVLLAMGLLAIEAFWGVTMTIVAARVHGLTRGRAVFAGWASFVAWLVPALGCCGLSALLAEALPT